MKRTLAVCLILFVAVIGCGQHRNKNRSKSQSGDSFQGTKPIDPAGLMQEAIASDDLAQVVTFISKGFQPDTLLPNGRTPLIDATIQSKYRIMIELLKHAADKNVGSKDGKTALDYARESAGKDEDGNQIVNRTVVLLDFEAQISQRKELMKFARRGSADPLMRLLRDVGVDPNFVDESGETPLTAAIRKKKLNSVNVLARWTDCPAGGDQPDCLRLTPTDINLAGTDGMSPLLLAKKIGVQDIINVLIEMKAKE